MSIIDRFFKSETKAENTVVLDGTRDAFKAFIPNFLYKPPFGYPRTENFPLIRQLAETPYIFSIIKTISDEASSVEYEIALKEETDETPELNKKLDEINKFFQFPNRNKENFENLLRQWIKDLLELDSAIIVKVFDENYTSLQQLFARDGATFLKNSDIYGYLGNKSEFVPFSFGWNAEMTALKPENLSKESVTYLKDNAAYFQYGQTGTGMPVPFGLREIAFMMQNPQSNSVYGTSPVMVLADLIKSLTYGANYHLDFYLNGNMPEGILSVPGAPKGTLEIIAEGIKNKIRATDTFGVNRRLGYVFPTTNHEVKWNQFTLSSKEMEILEAQKWYIKIVWMCFGVTPDEMGFTETSNRAIAEEQAKVLKRKALRPLLNIISHHLTNEIIPEFLVDTYGSYDEAVKNNPFEFRFIQYDIEEDIQKHTLAQMKVQMGVPLELVAVDLGINVDEMTKIKEENMAKQQEMMQNQEEEDEETEEEGFNDFFKKKSFKSNFQDGIEQAEKELNVNIPEMKYLEEDALDLFFRVGLLMVKTLNLEQKEIAKELFMKAFENNTPMSELIDQLVEKLSIEKSIAERIVRTESVRAANFGKLISYEKSGIVEEKRWRATIDHRTSDECKFLNNKTVELNGVFTDQNGDTFFAPPQHPNCRCSVQPVLKKVNK